MKIRRLPLPLTSAALLIAVVLVLLSGATVGSERSLAQGVTATVTATPGYPIPGEIVFRRSEPVGGTYSDNIYVVSIASGQLTPIIPPTSNFARHSWRPEWSPDGNKLAFSGCFDRFSSDASKCGIFVTNADGSNRTKVVSDEFSNGDYVRYVTDQTWAPNGQFLAYWEYVHINGFSVNDIRVVNVGTGEDYALYSLPTGEGRGFLQWSPLGDKLLFTKIGVGCKMGLLPVTIAGGHVSAGSPTIILDNCNYELPRWSPDGFSIGTIGVNHAFTVLDLNGNVTRIYSATYLLADFTWSPDMQYIAGGGNLAYNRIVLYSLINNGQQLAYITNPGPVNGYNSYDYELSWRPGTRAPTATNTPTVTNTRRPTKTPNGSETATRTRTPTLTRTPTKTRTPTITKTPSPTCGPALGAQQAATTPTFDPFGKVTPQVEQNSAQQTAICQAPTRTNTPTATPTVTITTSPEPFTIWHVRCGLPVNANARTFPSSAGWAIYGVSPGTTIYVFEQRKDANGSDWARITQYDGYNGHTLWLNVAATLDQGVAASCTSLTPVPPTAAVPQATPTVTFPIVPPGCLNGYTCPLVTNLTATPEDIIAFVLTCEAGNDLRDALSIAWVVFNRANSGQFHGTPFDVVRQQGAFDCYLVGATPGSGISGQLNAIDPVIRAYAQILLNGQSLPRQNTEQVARLGIFTYGYTLAPSVTLTPNPASMLSNLSTANGGPCSLSPTALGWIYVAANPFGGRRSTTVYFSDGPRC